jgi:hypothetical protein
MSTWHIVEITVVVCSLVVLTALYFGAGLMFDSKGSRFVSLSAGIATLIFAGQALNTPHALLWIGATYSAALCILSALTAYGTKEP